MKAITNIPEILDGKLTTIYLWARALQDGSEYRTDEYHKSIAELKTILIGYNILAKQPLQLVIDEVLVRNTHKHIINGDICTYKLIPLEEDKLAELMQEVAAATGDLDGDYISELKPQVEQMKTIYPAHDYISTMLAWIEEAEKQIDQCNEYEQLEQNMMPGLIDYCNGDEEEAEELAEEIAWNCIYAL